MFHLSALKLLATEDFEMCSPLMDAKASGLSQVANLLGT
jgi:hypothetical protein